MKHVRPVVLHGRANRQGENRPHARAEYPILPVAADLPAPEFLPEGAGLPARAELPYLRLRRAAICNLFYART